MTVIRHIAYLILLAVPTISFGQQFYMPIDTFKGTVQLETFTTDDGLPSNVINQCIEGRDGFLWIGTREGLVRYDGSNFVTFSSADYGFGSNDVYRLAQIEDDWLVLLCASLSFGDYGGTLWRFNTITHQVESYSDKYPALSPNAKYRIKQQSDSLVFIYSDSSGCFILGAKSGLKELDISTLYADFFISHDGTIWQVRADFDEKMFYKSAYNIRGDLLEEYKRPTDQPLFSFMGFTKNNRPYFSYDEQTSYQVGFIEKGGDIKKMGNAETKSKPFKYFFKGDNEPFLTGSSPWLRFDNSAFYILGDDEQSFIMLMDSAQAAKIADWDLTKLKSAKDKYALATTEGLHFATITNNRFDIFGQQDTKFKNVSVRGIAHDTHGTIYFNSIIGIFSTKNGIAQHISERAGMGLQITDNNYCYFNGRNYLYRIDLENSSFSIDTVFGNDKTKTFWSIFIDQKERIWLGSEMELYLFYNWKSTPKKLGQAIFKEELPNTLVYQIFELEDTMWFATSSGAYWFHEKSNTSSRLQTQSLDLLKDVHQIQVDKQNWWFATNGNGLVKWNKKAHRFEQWTVKDGLSSNVLYACLLDDDHNLWISSDYGLMHTDTLLSRITTYTEDHGLPHHEFNRGSWHKDPTGNLYFGSINGLVRLNPKDFKLDLSEYSAPLQIIDFAQYDEGKQQLNNLTQQVRLNHQIILEPGSGFFTLSCKLLDFEAKDKQYAYRFKELNEGWKDLKGNVLQIGGLPYGKFSLEIKAQNIKGHWSSKQLKLQVSVLKPFYIKWWFLLICGLAIIGAIGAYVRFRTWRLTKEQDRLQGKVKEQTAEISQSLKEKEVLLKEVHHRVKNNLQIISSLLNLERNVRVNDETKKVLLEARQRIKSMALIHKNLYQYDDLSEIKLLPYLIELVKGLHQTYRNPDKEIRYQIESELENLDVDRAIPIGLIITELVSNSFKYAFNEQKEGLITVEIKQKEIGFDLIIADNGVGMPNKIENQAHNESLGLRLVELLAKQLRANYSINNIKGTCYIFEFSKQLNKSRN